MSNEVSRVNGIEKALEIFGSKGPGAGMPWCICIYTWSYIVDLGIEETYAIRLRSCQIATKIGWDLSSDSFGTPLGRLQEGRLDLIESLESRNPKNPARNCASWKFREGFDKVWSVELFAFHGLSGVGAGECIRIDSVLKYY